MSHPSIRIRGIYATALSALGVSQGFEVVEVSPVIAERLGLPAGGQAEVRLRDRPDRQGVRIEGAQDTARAVAQALVSLLPDAVARQVGSDSTWDVEFPRGSKRRLDEARATVWPTIPQHHQLKIVAPEAVDRAEEELANNGRPAEVLADDLRERFITRAFRSGRDVVIWHVKPHGRELALPGRIASLHGGLLRLTRRFRPGGHYDSLDAPKLAGDYGEVEQLDGGWVSRRRYLRADGSLIGELYNIQTPAELYPDGVRYLDLEVDVAVWPGGRVEVVDQDDLEEAVRAGWIVEPLAVRALEVADEVRSAVRRGGEVDLAVWG